MGEPVEKYRPQSGTEGCAFIEHYCDRCERDKAFREGTGDSCPIVAATFRYDVDAPDYPSEWRYMNGEPVCTAFKREGEGYRCDKTPDMFAPSPDSAKE